MDSLFIVAGCVVTLAGIAWLEVDAYLRSRPVEEGLPTREKPTGQVPSLVSALGLTILSVGGIGSGASPGSGLSGADILLTPGVFGFMWLACRVSFAMQVWIVRTKARLYGVD